MLLLVSTNKAIRNSRDTKYMLVSEPPPGLGRTQGWWFWADSVLLRSLECTSPPPFQPLHHPFNGVVTWFMICGNHIRESISPIHPKFNYSETNLRSPMSVPGSHLSNKNEAWKCRSGGSQPIFFTLDLIAYHKSLPRVLEHGMTISFW